jgi:SAM-dependent methyltransferase
LWRDRDRLICANHHEYAVVEGIPILLLREANQTHVEGERSLAVAEAADASGLPQFKIQPGEIDPFVNRAIGATNGSLYQHLVGHLKEYPIPELHLRRGNGELFLEIGCNWGRWCIAAARLGYRPIGIDPSLKSIRAARRVARQLGVKAHYVVADGRFLPFGDGTIHQAFSYSVLQHLSRENVRLVLKEVCRVLESSGGYRVQMPNTFGLRCLYHQARRGFREAHDFEVRYWRPRQLTSTFGSVFGSARLSVDGYFSLNPQMSDLRLLPRKYRALVRLSHALRQMSENFQPLVSLADSLYVSSP